MKIKILLTEILILLFFMQIEIVEPVQKSEDNNNYGPMNNNEIREFKIDKKKKPKCRLENDVIMIKKEENVEKEPLFLMVGHDHEGLSYVDCKFGQATALQVSEHAQQCGIATILLHLCFNEKTIHRVVDKENNAAVKLLKDFSEAKLMPNAKKIEEWVHSNCKNLVKVTMSCLKLVTGHVYFSAALASGYTKMFFALDDEFYPKEGPGAVKELKKFYTNDGYILQNDGIGQRIKVYGQTWFFCKPRK